MYTAVIWRVITQSKTYVMCCQCGTLFWYLVSITNLIMCVEALIIFGE